MPRRTLIVGETDIATTHPELASQLVDTDPTTILSGSNKKFLWKCSEGHTWTAMALSRSKDGRGCPYCSGLKAIKGVNDLATLRPDIAKEMISSDPSEFKEFSGSKETWRCACGHEWKAQISNRTSKGSGCPKCKGSLLIPGTNDLKTKYPEIASEILEVDPGKVFSKSYSKVSWKCRRGHTWVAQISARTSQTTGCPYCSGRSRIPGENTLDVINPVLSRELVKPELASSLAPSSHKKVMWVCANDHTWEASITSRSRGRGCPMCSSSLNKSKAEIEILEYISNKYSGDVESNTRSIIKGELDIYIPDLSMAIEYNGIYYHSEAFRDSRYHKNKVKACEEKGIQLISIWEDEYNYRKDIVLRMLDHKLNVSSQDKVFARKTKVSVLKKEEAYDFLENNHIQGKASGSYYLGLREKSSNNLVAVMVLTRTKNTLTLDRYATSCLVMGGQSKLLSYVDKNIPYDEIVTFADLSVSNGDLYERTGWTKDKELAPDYRYVVKGKREHKFNYRVKRFKTDPNLKYEEGLTERELAELNNLYRIYDCGKIRYVRRNPNEVSTGD